jgi:hypothetical protein
MGPGLDGDPVARLGGNDEELGRRRQLAEEGAACHLLVGLYAEQGLVKKGPGVELPALVEPLFQPGLVVVDQRLGQRIQGLGPALELDLRGQLEIERPGRKGVPVAGAVNSDLVVLKLDEEASGLGDEGAFSKVRDRRKTL